MRRTGIAVMARLIGLVAPLLGWMLAAILMGLVGHLCATFISVIGAAALLELAMPGSAPLAHTPLAFLARPEASGPNALAPFFIAIALCAVFRGVLRYGEQASNHYIAFKLLARIREKVFAALRQLAPAKLEGRQKGDLVALITQDVELLEVFYAHTISPVAIAALFSAMMVAFMSAFSPWLGLLAAAAYLAVGVLAPWAASKIGAGIGDMSRAQSGALSAFVLDSLRGLDETLQYGDGQNRLAQMQQRTQDLLVQERRLKSVTGHIQGATQLIILMCGLLMAGISGWLYGQGLVGFSATALCTLALLGSFGPCVALANLGATLQQTLAAGNRVLDILDETPQVEEVSGQPIVHFDGAEASGVTFDYGDESVLRDVNMRVVPSHVTALMGKSGSGKSTLLKLLMRFWEVEQGEVEISGTSIDSINTHDLRAMESYMTQDTHLFDDTIANNLRIAKLDATDAELHEACRQASIHDFICSLPKGYDTPVGELGDSLSGGERQRLGLARAFLHDAPLLLLDEPTSNLDSLNEAVILQSLRRQRGRRTVVLVSHRASAAAIADDIVTLDQGRAS